MKQKTKFKQTEIGKIPEDWEVKELGNVAYVEMGQSPPGESYNQRKEGTRFLQGVRTFGKKYPSFDTYTTHVTKKAKAGSVLLSVRAPVGEVNITKENLCIGRGLAVLNMKNENNEFLYYLLKRFNSLILGRETGSVFGSIDGGQIKDLMLPFPSNKEQISIAKILSSLDAKIELNNKMNQILETIGQALFKKWFLSSEFNEEIELGELIEFVKGKKPEEVFDKSKDNSLPQILIDVLDGNPPKYALIKDNSTIIMPSEVLMIMDGASSGRVEIGFEGILGSTLAKIKATDERISDYYLYYFLKERQEDIKGNTTGTSIPHADKGKIERFVLNIPDKKILVKFDKIAEQIQKKVFINKYEIVKLSQIRDLLLPKLMSGEIRVK